MQMKSSMPNALDAHAARVRQRYAERVVIATGAFGLTVALLALWWPTPDGPSVIAPIPPLVVAAPVVPVPAVPAPTEPAVVTGAAIEVTAVVPTLALPHEDAATDFEAAARIAVIGGDLRGALTALRLHLYRAPPTSPVLMEVARLASELGELALAEQALLDAGALEPTNADISIERGRILLEAGELTEAREAARQAIRIDDDNPSAWNLAGRVALAQSEWQRAELAFRQAVQRDPTDPMLHNNLGLLYVHMKKADYAIDALETSRELYGDDTPAFVHNNLGLAYEQAHRWSEAREAFADALTVLPDYARAALNLRRVLEVEQKASEEVAQAERTAELMVAPRVAEPIEATPDLFEDELDRSLSGLAE